jgi:hypothetical protein
MRIEKNEAGFWTIFAEKDKVLTNGEAYSEVGGSAYLGINDSEYNWWEITEEEYQEILAKQEEENLILE